jgi:hypothetical protein
MSLTAPKLCLRALALAGAALFTSGTTAAVAATTPPPRYATPSPAQDADCSSVTKACDLYTAVTNATTGGEVIVLPGTYTLGGTPIVDPQGVTLNIHGLDPQHRPVLKSVAPTALAVDDTNSTIADLDVRDTNRSGTALTFRGILADRILARAPGNAGACELLRKTTLRNSVCVASNPNAAAIRVYGYGNANPVTLRNVTAISTDPAGLGVSADEVISGTASFQLTMVNSIARVMPADPLATITGFDISANTNFGPVVVIAQDSNWSRGRTAGNGTEIDVVGTKQSQFTPTFVDPANFDYHEAANSHTIGAATFVGPGGPGDPANGAVDIDGDARAFISTDPLIANATDIGADQFVAPTPPPTTTTTTTAPPPPPTTTTVPTTTVPGPDTTPPSFSLAKVSPNKFGVLSGKRKKRVRYGTAVSFTVSEPAGVVATVQLKTPGRLVGKTCKKQTRSNTKHHKKCVLWVNKGSAFTRSVAPGASTKVTFSGKLGKRKLVPGAYRLSLVATDGAKNHSLPKLLPFQIVRG